MRITRVKLENFRSYKEADFSLPDGVILFEGDIGSGKSSILYAIEFALFGLGELKASHLLRHGADKASAEVFLEVNGSRVRVKRFIEKKNSRATQLPGVVEVDGVEATYSPAEMKPAILRILGFNEPGDPKSTSVIYRYAVFTPQEEMKAVLNEKPDNRLQTLRKVFGVEEYKNARDNAKTYSSHLKKRCEYLRGSTRDLESEEKRVQELLKEAGEKERALESAQQKGDALKKALAEALKKEEELGEKKSLVATLKAEIASLEGLAKRMEAFIERSKKELEENQEKAIQETKEPEKPKRLARQVEEELREARAKADDAREKEAVARAEVERVRKLVEQGRCPTCGQEIGREIHEHAEQGKRSADELSKHSLELNARVNALETGLEEARRLEQARKEFELKAESVEQSKKRVKELSGLIEGESRELREKINELNEKSGQAEKLGGAVNEWSRAREERKALEKQFNLVEKGGAATKAVLEKTIQEIVDRKKRVEEARQERKELEETLDRVEWLDQKFVPVLENVEEEVLGVINREFDAQLRKWVNVLLEGAELEARVDASFTPQITQDNYEQDVNALSGGEKTAIALAYRLALNELTRREYGSLKENLLILDEPTDGFSREQLQKMRAVFDSINGQVIVVSHERELEAFVDKVFHVVKNGASEVVA